MLTRVALNGIRAPKLIPEVPESDNLLEENQRLRRHINRLAADLYEFQRTVKGYLDGLNNKGVLSISQATIDASTLGTCNLQGTCYADDLDFNQSGTAAWNLRTTSDEFELYTYLGTAGVKHTFTTGGRAIHSGDYIRIATSKTPATAAATGTAGDFAWDTSYLYIATGVNTWRRVAHATW